MAQGTSDKSALKFIVILGIVSLCADATYEGARSITGAYLGVLGASALMGILYDRSINSLIIFSVLIQLAAVPILLFVNKNGSRN